MSHFSNLVLMSLVSFTSAVPFPIFLYLVFSLPPLFQFLYGFPALLFLISFLLSSVFISRLIFSQFGTNFLSRIIYIIYTNGHIPDLPVDCSLFLRFQLFFYELVSYFQNLVQLVSLVSCQLLNSQFSFCLFLLFQFSSFLPFVSEFAYHVSSLGILFKM